MNGPELFKAGARLCRTGGGVETMWKWCRDNKLTDRERAFVERGYAAEVRNQRSAEPQRKLGGGR